MEDISFAGGGGSRHLYRGSEGHVFWRHNGVDGIRVGVRGLERDHKQMLRDSGRRSVRS